MIYRFALARGLGGEDAEDVTQHCLQAISNHIADFSYDPGKGKFKGWLRTLVNNRIRDMLRARTEQQGRTRDFQDLRQREPDPEDAFEVAWMGEHLGYCLRAVRAEVEETTFLAFQRYVIDQWPIEKVCAALELKPNNVYTIKWRLTEQVAAKMKELLDDID